MSDPQQQKKLLAVLVVILVGFATYRAIQLTGEGQAASRRSRGANPVERVLAELEVPRLNLQSLRREAATYTPGRDPFRFGAAPKPAQPVRQRPKETTKPKRKRRQPAPVPAATPAKPPAPRPPEVTFTYLGSFGPSDRRIAVFVKGDEIFNALAGDVLLKNFIVSTLR